MPRLRANRCACWFWQFLDARAGPARFLAREFLELAIAVAAALAAALAAVLVAAHTAVKSHNHVLPIPLSTTTERDKEKGTECVSGQRETHETTCTGEGNATVSHVCTC